jgi:ankyrin repeat protein
MSSKDFGEDRSEDDINLDERKPSLAKLLKYGVDPNSLAFEDPGERRTLLCLSIEEAVKIEDFSKITLLLDHKADPNLRCETGAYPLQLAVKHRQMQLARDLLQRKADVNQLDEKQVSPLHLAAHHDQPRIIQLLLMHKANVNAGDRFGQTPTFFCSSRNAIYPLLEAEADLLHLNKRGQSCLHMAAHMGATEAVGFYTERDELRQLLDMQDERGHTPLHHAARKAHQCAVSRLMDMGADPRLKTNLGQTAMSLADAKDVEVAYYIYTRMTGGNKSTWAEVATNPIALTMAAIIGVACFVNRTLLWEFTWDLIAIYRDR